jgi:hypothetical protein
MSMMSVDDLIVKVQNNEPVVPVIAEKAQETESESPELGDKKGESDANEGDGEEKLTHLEKFRKDKEEFLAQQAEDAEDAQENKPSDDKSRDDKADDNSHEEETDDYGNKVPKGKVYTEEQVQAMIRKRLKLSQEEKQQPQQQQYQPPVQQTEGFEHDPNNEQPWEIQLENHIKQTVQKLETEKQQVAWQAEQQRAQAEFEHRFSSGMSKYQDFNDVVSGKPITNGIMMAARSMADPAAFIYAASKQQPAELERISKITDPYVLAAEVGRLEERMKKARTISKAPKPPTKTKGDIADKGAIKQNLDDLIRMDAKRKLGRK